MDDATPQAIGPVLPDAKSSLVKQCLGLGLVTLFLSTMTGHYQVLIIGVLVFADAWIAGIRKQPRPDEFRYISAMGWGVATDLLFVVAFPLYLLNRNRLKSRQGSTALWLLLVVMGSVTLLWLLKELIVGGISLIDWYLPKAPTSG